MPKFKHVLLAIAIAIVFVFFVGVGISSFYNAPEYEDYCEEEGRHVDTVTKQKCENVGGKWNPREAAIPEKIEDNQLLCTKISEKDDAVTLNCQTQEQLYNQGYCEWDFYCREEFEEENEKYSGVVFIVAIIIGLIALVSGIALNVPSVSSGLMGGGILTILYGTIRYWFGLPDFARFILLGITLGILICVGYKKLKK